MLQRIYSSKMFLASKRKDDIRHKIEAAENQELVQQLIRDLSPEYQTLNNVAPELTEEKQSSKSDDSKPKVNDDSVNNTSHDSSDSSMNTSHTVGQPIEFDESDDTSDTNAEDSTNQDDEAESEPESIEQSIKLDVVPIDVIKGTLNHSSDTAGVARIEVKNHELWIYYSDETNLNSIMTDVIESLNNVGYTYLSFNRLARSNNAIVFEIAQSTNMVGDIIE